MKKTILYIILCIIFISSASAINWNSVDRHYNFTTPYDSKGGFNGTFTNGANISGIILDGRDFPGNAIFDIPDWDPTNDFSVNCWVNKDDTTGTQMLFSENVGYEMYFDNTDVYVYAKDGSCSSAFYCFASGVATTTGSWVMWTAIYNITGSVVELYENNIKQTCGITGSPVQVCDKNENVTIGSRAAAIYLNGGIDECTFFDYTLTESNISDLYNGSSGLNQQNWDGYDAGGSPPPAVSSNTTTETYEVNVTENTTTSLNLTISWINTNVTGTGATLVYNNTEYAPSIDAVNYAMNGSINYSYEITTPIILYNYTDFTFYWNYNLTLFDSDISSYNTTAKNQSILFNYTRLNITNVYNAYTLNNISNYTGYVLKGSWNRSFNITNGGQAFIPLDNGSGNYTIYVEALNHAISNSTNFQNLEIINSSNLTQKKASFGLYTNNSVLVNVYDETTFDLITSNITLTISGNSTEVVYNFINGTTLIENLSDGQYNFKFEAGGNYTIRIYAVEVAERSFQTLNAYLSPTTNYVTLTFLDYDSSASLEGVSTTMSRLINSSWVVVESKTSDITGRSQFSYITAVKYRFYTTLSGYTAKTFDLDPVLFASYNVRLNRILVSNQSIDYSEVYISFTPKKFYNDVNNNLSFFFASPTGSFESYSYNITYPSGSVVGSGINALGENFDTNFSITGATFFDVVNVTYTYDLTTSEPRTYSFLYYIDGGTQGNNTYLSNLDETYGLGTLERVLISTIIVLIVGGSIALFLGALAGLSVSIIFMGIFAAIGFYPLWLFLISALAGVILIIKAGS